MESREVEKCIISFLIDEYKIKVESPKTDNFKIEDDWGLDSLEIVELSMRIEREFNLPWIDDTLVEKWKNMTILQISEQVSSEYSKDVQR